VCVFCRVFVRLERVGECKKTGEGIGMGAAGPVVRSRRGGVCVTKECLWVRTKGEGRRGGREGQRRSGGYDFEAVGCGRDLCGTVRCAMGV
jgi:hypothetical protein